MKLLVFVSIVLMLQSCAVNSGSNKHYISYGSEAADKWKENKLKQCHLESAILTLSVYEARPWMTEMDVRATDKKIMDSCIRYHQLDI